MNLRQCSQWSFLFSFFFPQQFSLFVQLNLAESLLLLFWLLFLLHCLAFVVIKIYMIPDAQQLSVFITVYPSTAIILSLWCAFIKKKTKKTHTHAQVWSFMAASQSLTFTIWLPKLWRGLGLSLIRSCGAKSNQCKREQRAKPSLYKRVSVARSAWLLSPQDSEFGGWSTAPLNRLFLLFTSSPSSPTSHASFSGVRERGSERDEEFLPPTPPPAHTA